MPPPNPLYYVTRRKEKQSGGGGMKRRKKIIMRKRKQGLCPDAFDMISFQEMRLGELSGSNNNNTKCNAILFSSHHSHRGNFCIPQHATPLKEKKNSNGWQ